VLGAAVNIANLIEDVAICRRLRPIRFNVFRRVSTSWF